VNGGEFSELDPDGLISHQMDFGGFGILDLVQEFVSEIPGRAGSKRVVYSALKSFFMHNRVPLPQDPSFTVRGDLPMVTGGVSVEEFKFALSGCNELYQAVYLCMFQGAMGLGELVYWSDHGWEDLRDQLRLDVNPIKISLPGRKKGRNIRPYYTFIGHDAVEALERWFKVRPLGAKTIFTNQFDDPLTQDAIHRYWTDHLKKIGIIKVPDVVSPRTRYGKNPHELRDLFRTRWQKSGRAPEVAEFFMGHVIDPLGYNKAMSDENYTRREYRQASKWLNVISESPDFMHIDVSTGLKVVECDL